MAGCVFAYFAECTVVMPLFLSLNCYTAKCGRRNAEVRMGVVSQARLPWLSSPHFIMFSGYQFNKKKCAKNKVTLH